jgi:hypothetical protein|tara:strand:+ start:756 stop:1262 length:507 start_codon:yes stop_codon:yes gene_type:complete
MNLPKVELNWEEIVVGATTGVLRQTENMRQKISWGSGADFDWYKKWGQTISGSLAEQALAKKMQSYFSHSVNNFHGSDLKINGKSVQVRSQLESKKTNNLIVRKDYKKTDYYFLVLDDLPTFYFAGYVAPHNIERLGEWTNFHIQSRPYVWSIPKEKLTPLEKFKYER